MAYEQRLGQCLLFTNRDPKSDKAPDLTGKVSVQVGDRILDLDIAAWWRKSEKAGEFLSLSVKVKQVRSDTNVRRI